ncbi:MAG TPA: DNA polymerase III subunit alpha [Candidatus Saccharimonadales bacterium]|nr:DNA polymerase III subunit alpha [Candidatus Saccharimonadales bacterium]
MSKAATDLQASDYVHLHNHTHYSVLDGLQKVPETLSRAQDMGMEAMAITDHGTLSGAIEFYKVAQDKGMKPIIGMETYVAPRTIADKDPAKDKARYHLILLAMNQKGLENLFRLSSIAWLEGYYYKQRIDHLLLERYNEGLIVLSGCIGGEVGEHLRQDQDDKAYEFAKWYKSIFGDRYYIEVQDHGHPDHPHKWDEQIKVNQKLLKLAKDLDIPPVVTCDAHYASPEDKDAHEILLCVQTGANLSEESRFSLKDFDLFVEDPQAVITRWGTDHPEVIANTRAIAERCEIKFDLGGIHIPKFDVPEGHTEKTFLDELVYQGLAERYEGLPHDEAHALSIEEAKAKLKDDVLQRTEYELGVIDRMGFNGYMLIVQDFINWGKDQGIIFGPGRGSAAGSIIAFALRITDIDPLKYDLLFERFLNPDRISMPDIDVDIQDTRRNEVIEYCAKKYGSSRVSNIVTFGTMAARAAVRDVARTLEVPYAEADRLAKMVPQPVQGRHIPLAVSIQEDPDLKKEYQNNPTSKRVIDLASRLEGTIRSHGVHACGVVIAPDDVVKFLPLEMAQKGVVATQFPMGQVEELGLLKMDFLGLSNLTIIKNAMRIIKRVNGVDIDLEKMPLDDPKAYELLASGDTTGVFQLESAGMKRYLKELKPTVFDDIIAMVALYRPGPMQFIDDFIARKHGRKQITYMHPLMKNALENTYGILVYQEQVMQISKELSGFTGGQADTLRKAIGKKKIDVMQKMKVDFIEGAIKNGAERESMEKFWKQLEDFAAYCFNKSHAACYGLIAYWTAYLKAYYPAAFMAALMTSDQDDTDRLAIEITECKHMGLEVLAPDVNESFGEFAVVPGTSQIRFGLNAVKNVGANAVETILAARQAGGEFASIEDYAKRVNCRIVNRKNLESLIKAGAFDRYGNRSDLLFNLDGILAFASKLQKEAESGQANLFGDIGEALPAAHLQLESAPTQVTEQEVLQWERELLGLYLSSHPLDSYETYLMERTHDLLSLKQGMDGCAVTVGGVISAVRQIATKKGDKMAFVKVEGKAGETELIIFPKTYEKCQALLEQDRVIIANGTVSAKDRNGNLSDEIKVLADDIRLLTLAEMQEYKPNGERLPAPKKAMVTGKRGSSRKPWGGGGNGGGYQPKAAPAAPQVVKSVGAAAATPTYDGPPRTLYVHVRDPNDHNGLLKLKQSLNDFPGNSSAVLVLGDERKSAIKLPFTINPHDALLSSIRQLFGEECVILK